MWIFYKTNIEDFLKAPFFKGVIPGILVLDWTGMEGFGINKIFFGPFFLEGGMRIDAAGNCIGILTSKIHCSMSGNPPVSIKSSQKMVFP
jgi:hypothetical protein